MATGDAAVNLVAEMLRADTTLSKQNGAAIGQSPAGVGARIYTGERLPSDVRYPAILIFVTLDIARGIAGSGDAAMYEIQLIVKIHTEGLNLTARRRIGERVETVLRGFGRRTWADADMGTAYYVVGLRQIDAPPQGPDDISSDRVVNYRNLSYQAFGRRTS